jgi:putative ABC transport system permease protein
MCSSSWNGSSEEKLAPGPVSRTVRVVTTRSLPAGVPLGALGTLAILSIASFVMVNAVVHEPTPASGGLFDSGPPPIVTITPADAQQVGARRPRSLTTADVDAVAHDVPDIVALSRVVLGTAPVAVGSQTSQIRIEGVDPSFAQVTNDTLAQGTLFGSRDASAANPVAVLGHAVAARLFPGASPVGQSIRIRGVPFTVIGVMAGLSVAAAGELDDAILVPFQTGQVRLFGPTSLDAVLLRIRDASQMAAVSLQVEELLRQRHDVRSGQPDGFTITADIPASTGGPFTQTTGQLLGRIVEQYGQYTCQAKGLCPAPQA